MKHSYTVCLPCAVIDEAKAEGTEKLLDEKPLQIMLVENSITTIGDGGHVILDFGREIAGRWGDLFVMVVRSWNRNSKSPIENTSIGLFIACFESDRVRFSFSIG